MWVMVQRLSPGVQHRDRADLGAEVARVDGDAVQRLRRRAEQNGVDRRLVVERDLGDGCGQREHDVEIGDGSNSAWRASSQSARARAWHFGQCLSRHEL
jgi:KaiC/GvpD/RAD55 family RecA-like ATPase